MRKTATTLTVLLAAVSAQADVAVDFPQIDNSSAPALSGFVTQDIRVLTTNDWTTTGMVLNLTGGSIYQDPFDNGTFHGGELAPSETDILFAPSVEFDTYVGQVGGASQGIGGGAGDLGGSNPYQFDTQGLDVTWFDIPNGAGGSYGLTSIGRLSLSDDAQGTLRLSLSEAKNAYVPYEFNIVDGRVQPDPVCNLPGDDACGYGILGLSQLDTILSHWNQIVPTGDHLQGDYHRDGFVGLDDLDVLLSMWNKPTYAPSSPLSYSFHCGDFGCGFVGLIDLDIVLSNWNIAVPPANPVADHVTDGYIGQDDLNAVLSEWNAGTPPVAVPEPASLLCVLVGAPFCLRRRV